MTNDSYKTDTPMASKKHLELAFAAYFVPSKSDIFLVQTVLVSGGEEDSSTTTVPQKPSQPTRVYGAETHT